MDLTDFEIDQDEELQKQRQEKQTAILRIFNYYRTFLSFSLLLLFIQVPDQQFVGKAEPNIFQITILSYIGLNILISLISLVAREDLVARTSTIFSILMIDIVLLALLMYASGGVATGLGNFLIFPVAFAGVLIVGRVSLVIAAIAAILTFYCEFNLMMRDGGANYDVFFQAGLLGAVLFSVNLLFQYVSKQLRKKEAEVTTLEKLNEMRRIAEITRHELEDSNARFEVLLNSAGEGVLGLDLNGKITFANPKACALLEVCREELVGMNVGRFAQLETTVESDGMFEFQSYNLLHELQLKANREGHSHLWQDVRGATFYVEYSCEATLSQQGELAGAVVLFQDVTERKETEQKMHYLANYDALTDLVNRSHFQAGLEKAIARAKRGTSNVAVLLLDLDHFKYVNDRYGHDTGDALLSEASKRLMSCIRTGDTAARLGGDEFAIMLLDFVSANNVAIVARNLIDEISRPYHIGGVELNISTSIGVSVFDGHDTPDSLLKAADTAMYEAKNEGRGIYRFFHADMQEKAEQTQRIQVALQKAIERNEFKINYQPIVSLDGGSIHHSEALIRWKPHGADPIPPDVFIPIAEECGRINEIGDWMLQKVIEQIQAWHTHLGMHPRIAVNVSTKQLKSPHFRDQVKRHLEEYDVPVDAIELELTETGVMDDPETVMKELIELHKLGIKLSIDDFGTGYSSLDYLRRLPIDQVKIDKTFVNAIGQENDQEIVKVIIAMAHTMGLDVVAEGIETEQQVTTLKALGCDLGQGYLFSEPIDTLGLTSLMKERHTDRALSADKRPSQKVVSFHSAQISH